ncbi:MAG: CDP-alcohol phosphatidyltransferase family protein [bacterium]|nr:CDP-alcohol phosphatidyltransferase family protein [bacterium]
MYLIPCTISVLRALSLIPLLLLFPSHPRAAFFVFMAGAVSDWFDGFLARKFKAESELGKILDPVSDKIFYLGLLVTLKDSIPILIILIPALLFEVLLTAIRFKKSHRGKRAANPYGKLKTTVQFCAIACMMLGAIMEVKILTAFGFSLGLIAIPLAMMSLSAHIYPNEKAASI